MPRRPVADAVIDPNKALAKAGRLYRQGKHSDVIHLLEPQVFLFRDEPRFYVLLGMACFYAQDFGGAETYLARAVDLSPDDNEARLGLAALRARKGEVQRAIRDWLAILESDPSNRIARNALDLVRKSDTESAVQRTLHGRAIMAFLPKRKRRSGSTLSVLAVLAVAVLGSWGVVFFWGQSQNVDPRPGAELLRLETADVERLVDYAGSFRYTLTEEGIDALLEDLRSQFHDERDNLARRTANRLLHSNASGEIKRRVALLTDYFDVPDLVSLQDNFSYRDVAEEPWLYEGCHVKWRGRVANLSVSDEALRFDLLVGFDDERVLEGIVPTQFAFGVAVDAGTNVEVLGEVRTLGENQIGLRGVAVRLLGPGDSS